MKGDDDEADEGDERVTVRKRKEARAMQRVGSAMESLGKCRSLAKPSKCTHHKSTLFSSKHKLIFTQILNGMEGMARFDLFTTLSTDKFCKKNGFLIVR